MAGNKMGALKRKLGLSGNTELEPGTLIAAQNKKKQEVLEVAIKGLI